VATLTRAPKRAIAAVLIAAYVSGCAVVSSGPPEPQAPDIRQVSPQQAQRVYRVMAPLLAAMNKPRSPKEVYIGILDDPEINAANAGGGHFYVTTGLLQKANDNQLRGILAHEIAHDDLGHVPNCRRSAPDWALASCFWSNFCPAAARSRRSPAI
jgi:Zn-dependent protease with chaperone function